MHKSRLRGWTKRILSGVLSLTLLTALVAALPWRASEVSALRSISEIENEISSLQGQISSLNSQLYEVVDSINKLTNEIADTEEQIRVTEANLAAAEEAEAKQYEDMKTRIRYMYENGESSMLTILLESGSVADFLNRVEYTNSIYEYDRELLDTYEALTLEIADMKAFLEYEKEELSAKKVELEDKEATLEAMTNSKKNQLAASQQELKETKELLAYLARLEAERKAAEERARQEAERQRQAELERQRQAAAAAAASASRASASTSTASSGGSGGGSGTAAAAAPSGTTYSGSGSAIVSYALQFVGNPYVWGGNSLTNGCDCSGFVHQVYAHFGISTPRYSQAFASVGVAVSASNLAPGDVIVYPGHVAIYAGNGVIVEAQDPAHGITANRAWNSGSVTAIRRLVQ